METALASPLNGTLRPTKRHLQALKVPFAGLQSAVYRACKRRLSDNEYLINQ